MRSAQATSLEPLQRELEQEVKDSGAFAGISVLREGGYATALLCRRGVSPCERLRAEMANGELSRSRLAVAVVERLRPIDLALTPTDPSPKPPPPEPAAAVPEPAPTQKAPRVVAPPVPNEARPLRAWFGGGVVLSSGTSAPMAWASASLAATLTKRWGFELAVAGSPLAGSAQSRAGDLSLHAMQALAFATFEPVARRGFELSFGLGGGALYLRESAVPAAGFDGYSASATVGIVSARTRLVQRLGPLFLGLAIDPGVLVPALKVEAGTETVLRIGRPWLALQASLGVEL